MWNTTTRRLLDGPNYAALATVHDCVPSCHMMWVGADDTFLYLNTEVARNKFRSLSIGARVAVMVFENSRSWAEIQGTVVQHIVGERAREHLDELSRCYNGRAYGKRIDSSRVIVQVQPDREFVYTPATPYQEGGPLWR